MDCTYSAGVWEQGRGYVAWSGHRTEQRARAAARCYAGQPRPRAGGVLSWAGGYRRCGDPVVWVDRDGAVIDAARAAARAAEEETR